MAERTATNRRGVAGSNQSGLSRAHVKEAGARFGQSWPGAPGVRTGFLAAKRGVSTMDRAAAGRDRSEGAPSRLLGLSSRALK